MGIGKICCPYATTLYVALVHGNWSCYWTTNSQYYNCCLTSNVSTFPYEMGGHAVQQVCVNSQSNPCHPTLIFPMIHSPHITIKSPSFSSVHPYIRGNLQWPFNPPSLRRCRKQKHHGNQCNRRENV